jgi:hypothetical protein
MDRKFPEKVRHSNNQSKGDPAVLWWLIGLWLCSPALVPIFWLLGLLAPTSRSEHQDAQALPPPFAKS